MAQKCEICDKDLGGFLTDAVRCKICNRLVCGRCQKDRICSFCREKMGKK